MNATAAAPEAIFEDQLINQYLEQLPSLSPNGRLELLARLARTMQSAKPEPAKKTLLDFAGAWADMPGTDEGIIADIRNARTFSRSEISLD